VGLYICFKFKYAIAQHFLPWKFSNRSLEIFGDPTNTFALVKLLAFLIIQAMKFIYVGLEIFKSNVFVPAGDLLKKYKHIRQNPLVKKYLVRHLLCFACFACCYLVPGKSY